MAGLSISGICKSFGPVQVLKDVSLEIRDGEFLTILGPSGCGKSTLLKILAGLETQDAGSICLGERQLDGLRPKHRDVAMVFQSYALYPHMTAAQNIALPLKMRRLTAWQRLPLLGALLPGTASTRKKIAAELLRVAAALGLEALLDRKPAQLSGGQRQRVALGRAMVRGPAVFLMDEPLSSLDAKLRVQMRAEIKDLHHRLGTTFIYVTHDQTEAMTLSDRVVVMAGGEILQVARPPDIYADPGDLRVAEFVGSPKINVLEGCIGRDGLLEFAGLRLPVDVTLAAGQRVLVGIRPEAPHLAEAASAASKDAMAARVRLVEHLGSDVFVHVEIQGAPAPFLVRLPVERASRLQPGDTLQLGLPAGQLLVFDAEGRRIRKSSSMTSLGMRALA
jgi:multiple sugar transport system ATP-binding protein